MIRLRSNDRYLHIPATVKLRSEKHGELEYVLGPDSKAPFHWFGFIQLNRGESHHACSSTKEADSYAALMTALIPSKQWINNLTFKQ